MRIILYMDIIIPKLPKNMSEQTKTQLYRWAQDEQEADRVMHEAYLQRVKAQSDGIGTKNVDGIGECYAQIDSRMYHRQLQSDPHFWDDLGNIKRFMKDNPQYLNDGYKV